MIYFNIATPCKRKTEENIRSYSPHTEKARSKKGKENGREE